MWDVSSVPGETQKRHKQHCSTARAHLSLFLKLTFTGGLLVGVLLLQLLQSDSQQNINCQLHDSPEPRAVAPARRPSPARHWKNLFSPMQKFYADPRAVQCGLSKRKINWRIVNRYMSKFCSRFRLWDNFPRPRRGANAGPREEPEKFKIKGKWLESSLSSLSRANDWHWSLTLSYCASLFGKTCATTQKT